MAACGWEGGLAVIIVGCGWVRQQSLVAGELKDGLAESP